MASEVRAGARASRAALLPVPTPGWLAWRSVPPSPPSGSGRGWHWTVRFAAVPGPCHAAPLHLGGLPARGMVEDVALGVGCKEAGGGCRPLGRGFRAFERVGARPAQVLSRQLQRPSPGLTTWGASAKATVASMRADAAAAALVQATVAYALAPEVVGVRRPPPRAASLQQARRSHGVLWVGGWVCVGWGVGVRAALALPAWKLGWGSHRQGRALGRGSGGWPSCTASEVTAGARASRAPCCLCPRRAGWPGGAFSLQRLLGGGGSSIGLFTLHLRPRMPWGVPSRGLWKAWRWGWLQGG